MKKRVSLKICLKEGLCVLNLEARYFMENQTTTTI